MAAKTYGTGYRITELRRYATEYKIVGRSKMTGDELLVAVLAVWDARRQAQEAETLAAGPIVPGVTVLRHRSSGYTIRATSEVQAWAEQGGALFITADYLTLDGWGFEPERMAARAALQNEQDARRTERGEVVRHPLWQYEIVTPEAPAQAELTETQFLTEVRRGIAEGTTPAQQLRDEAHAEALETLAPQVDLDELTERMGLPAWQREGAAAFVGGRGPWTEDEAAELVHVWQNTNDDGVYVPPAGESDHVVNSVRTLTEGWPDVPLDLRPSGSYALQAQLLGRTLRLCTHGDGCPVHPDVHALHNFDGEAGRVGLLAAGVADARPGPDGDPDPAGVLAWDLSVIRAAVIAWAPAEHPQRLDVERRLQRVEDRLRRARQSDMDSDKQRIDELIERVCLGVPESWDDDASADSIIVDYVRTIEARLLARGGTLEKWEGDPDA